MEYELFVPRTFLDIMHKEFMDIQGETDVQKFVDGFYEKVVKDDLLGPIFNDVAQVDWDKHLPTMYAFWSAILLGKPGYQGAPFPVHAQLHEHITPAHFTRWLELFEANMDSLFQGPLADAAKHRARNIAMVFQVKMGLFNFQAPR